MKFKIGDRVVRTSNDKELLEVGEVYSDCPVGTEAVVVGFPPEGGFEPGLFDAGAHYSYYMYEEDWELIDFSLENE